MAEVHIGSNAFYDVPFPVAIGNRYIHLQKKPDGGMEVQIFRWDPTSQTVSRDEISYPKDSAGPITVQPYGDAGGVRLSIGSDTIQGYATTGALTADSVLFLEDKIAVYHGDTPVLEVLGTTIQGFHVGIEIKPEGVSIGAPLPEGFSYRYVHEDQPVRLATLVSAKNPVLSGTDFVRCQIYGPALVAPIGPVSLESSNFDMLGAAKSSLVWELRQDQEPYGAILVRDVEFRECNFIGVAFAVPAGEVDATLGQFSEGA